MPSRAKVSRQSSLWKLVALHTFAHKLVLVLLSLLLVSLVGWTLTPSGTQQLPPASIHHTVTLAWAPSTVAGYNVYRGTVSGGPYTKINTALDSAAKYVDTTVQSGQTYYYVVTAVSTAGVESAYSKQVTAVVPSP